MRAAHVDGIDSDISYILISETATVGVERSVAGNRMTIATVSSPSTTAFAQD